jgi:hypothetical protein
MVIINSAGMANGISTPIIKHIKEHDRGYSIAPSPPAFLDLIIPIINPRFVNPNMINSHRYCKYMGKKSILFLQ